MTEDDVDTTAAIVSDAPQAGANEAEASTDAGPSARTEDAGAGDDAGPDPAEPTAEAQAGRSRTSRTKQLEREGEVAADFLERLLDIADLDGDLDVDIEGDRAVVAIVDSEEGRVPRRLVGPDGRVLEALQEVTRLAVQTATGEHSRLMLDVAGHRAERRRAVLDIARAAVEACKESGEPQPLEPMSAFERKVAHDEVLRLGLHSESEGAEPRRHVVVHPA